MLDIDKIHQKMMYGENSIHVPMWMKTINQNPVTAFVGASKDISLKKEDFVHTLYLGEIIVRPHYAIATDRYTGYGAEGLLNNEDINDLMNDTSSRIICDNLNKLPKEKTKHLNYDDYMPVDSDQGLRAMYGHYAIHIPAWFIVQDMGKDNVLFVGASKKTSLMYDTSKTNTLIVGEMIVRPHLIIGSNHMAGTGAIGLLTSGDFGNWAKKGKVIYDVFDKATKL